MVSQKHFFVRTRFTWEKYHDHVTHLQVSFTNHGRKNGQFTDNEKPDYPPNIHCKILLPMKFVNRLHPFTFPI